MRVDDQSDRDLKVAAIEKVLPDFDLSEASDEYLDGLLDAIEALTPQRNDSLAAAHLATHETPSFKVKPQLWTQPLARHL